MVTAPGLWAPVDVLAACRKASRCRFFEVDLRKAKVRNPGGLDEVRIARIIGADGIRPYLSRQSQYRVDACGTKVQRPVDGDIRALQGRGWTPRPELSLFKARAGDWTWVMFRVMSIKDGVVPRTSNSNYDFNRCLCTLQDTGLLTTALGKRGELATASHH
jgi:hypothetical protein